MKNLLIFITIVFLTSGGCSLRRYERRHARTATDTVTVRQTVVFNVPKDSAVLRVVTDTTRIIKEVRQGRATVRIVREPTYTTIYATCDSMRIAKEAIAKIPQRVVSFGVPKSYKIGFYTLLILLIALIAGIYLSRFFTINIARK